VADRGISYDDAGVNLDAARVLTEGIRDLTGLFRLDYNQDLFKRNYKSPVLVACTDGVGTKVKLASAMRKYDTIGIDLVAMNVNDLIVQGAEPLFFLDYLGLSKLDPDATSKMIEGVAKGCEQAGCALIGGECAEMPDIYKAGDFDIAGFCVGVVEKAEIIDGSKVATGDALIALPSSGPHSNGYSLVRRIVKVTGAKWSDPAPFAPALALGEALLEPTRIYVRPVLEAIRATGAVKALAHVTGGGFVDNIPRVLPGALAARIDLSAVPVPPVFRWLAKEGGLAWREMVRTFNCGIGMVLVADAAQAGAVALVLAARGEKVVPLGEVVERTGEGVVFQGRLGL